MKEYKIDLSMYKGKVREVVSEAVQRKALELGWWWFGVHEKRAIHKGASYIFTYADSSLTMRKDSDASWFNSHSNTLISAADFLALTPEDVKDAPKEPEFKPFDRVLVRDEWDREWRIDFFERMNKDKDEVYRYRCLNAYWCQCIPYEGNEHLLGTTEGVE